jgi:hypothetical protein
MNRRDFVALLGGAASWPLAARAQQGERIRRIGALMSVAADDPEGPVRAAAFAHGLQQLGWSVGGNVRIDYRWGGGDGDRIRSYAAELVALAPDVILATGSATLGPLLQATRTVPIVFVHVPDPVGAGFVDSLPRPGGNATGFTLFEYIISGKWLELLKEIAPRTTRAAVIRESRHNLRDRPMGRHPDRGAVGWCGGEPGQRARRRRDRARHHCIRALLEWRHNRDRERVGAGSSRSDCQACGPAQTARGLLRTVLPAAAWSPMGLI